MTAFCTVILTGSLAGCATGASETSTTANAAGTALKSPALPSLADVAALTSAPEKPAGSATEVYTRIASGANTCWFGAAGPLKKDYIYHAEADAPSRGGKAEIVVHVRDPSQSNPRGPKAFRVDIAQKGDAAEVKTENLKMAANVAAAMASDVDRWSKGDQGCQGASTVAGWGTVAPAAPAEQPLAETSGKKTKAKVAAKTGVKAKAP